MNAKHMAAMLELLEERNEMEALADRVGITQEEIDGYIEFFLGNYPELTEVTKEDEQAKHYLN